jgi:hypothetical protein
VVVLAQRDHDLVERWPANPSHYISIKNSNQFFNHDTAFI